MKLGRASVVKAWAKRTAQLPLVLTTSPFPSPLRRWPCRRCSVDCDGASCLQQPTTQDKTNFNLDVNEGLARSAPFNAVTSPSDDHKKNREANNPAIHISIGGPISENHPIFEVSFVLGWLPTVFELHA